MGTGLLTNYGFALKDYNQFQGAALSPANLLQNLGEWRLLYGALQTSVFNSNVGGGGEKVAQQLPCKPACSIATPPCQR